LAASIGNGPLAHHAQTLHGPGLRDTTRIAAASPELWADILLDNRTASLEAAAAFRTALAQIEQALQGQDRAALVQALARGATWRQTLEPRAT
jgi:prephenate dehydrogenase